MRKVINIAFMLETFYTVRLRPYLNKVLIADMGGYCTSEILAFDFGKINPRVCSCIFTKSIFRRVCYA